MARRLAEAKSLAVAARYRDALIIGCDQVAVGNGEVLGKPGTREKRDAPAARPIGKRGGVLHGGVRAQHLGRDEPAAAWSPAASLSAGSTTETIDRYLAREQPYDWRGSAKAEGLGIALIAKMEGEDPSALVGLPLIALSICCKSKG